MNKKTRTSVIMSVFNSAVFLSDSIESILLQSDPDFEFIIINDGSTDNSGEIIRRYAAKDKRIIMISKEKTGLTDSLNVGIIASEGEYIIRQDADDISMPDRIKFQVEFLDKYPEIDLVCSRAYVRGRGIDMVTKYYEEESLKKNMLKRNPIIHSSVCFRKESMLKIGCYNTRFYVSQDYDAWLRLLDVGRIAMLDRVLLIYRVTAGSISSKKRLNQAIAAYRARRNKQALLANLAYCFYQIAIGYLPYRMIFALQKILSAFKG